MIKRTTTLQEVSSFASFSHASDEREEIVEVDEDKDDQEHLQHDTKKIMAQDSRERTIARRAKRINRERLLVTNSTR